MEYLASASKHHSGEIAVPAPLRKRLGAAGGTLLKALQKSAHPFHFDISPTSNGVLIEGDMIGFIIASGLVRHLENTDLDNLDNEESSLNEIISSAMDNILKRELVFRLQGLPYALTPKSLTQVAFIKSLLLPSEQFIIGLGPTGTGKTHIAIAAALNQLEEGRVKRIILTKPHVVMEGEVVTLATRQELETHSQLEIYDDVFQDLIGIRKYNELREQKKLELRPLGLLRGRTLNDTFIILDEAQNMTVRKMRMAVTRIGRSSRMVITGDPAHVDLYGDEQSGLVHLLNLLEGTNLAKIYRFENNQIIRNKLVAHLERLYAGEQMI